VGTTDTALKPRSGLLTAIDVIIAPQAAFERIALAPTWVWAFLIATVVAIAYSFATLPAVIHAIDTAVPLMLAHNPQIASLPPAQQQKQIAMILGIQHTISKFGWIVQPISILFGALVQTLIMLVVNAAAKGKANFSRLWALAMNVAVVGYGVSYLVGMTVILVRGPDAYDTVLSLANAIPGLGMLAPPDAHVLGAFLAAFSLPNIWAAVLFVMGMRTIARVSLAPAITAAAIMIFGLALILAGQAAQAH
jgi:hypothetical protein